MTQPTPSSPRTGSRSALPMVGVVAALVLGAFFLGQVSAPGPEARWVTGSVQVVGTHATFEVDGWTYGFDSSVAWTDDAGSAHDPGWPDCLAELDGVAERLGAEPSLRLAWAPDGLGGRAVVGVDCGSLTSAG